MRYALRVLSIVIAVVALSPTPARADGYVNPFVGVNFGADRANGRGNFGVAAGWMTSGIAGLEFDFGYAPNFFGSEGSFGENHVLTAMGNLIVGIPIGGTHGPGLRPYATIGGGLVRTQVTGAAGPNGVAKVVYNDAGVDAGVGAMGFFSDHAGIRFDARYFRNFREDSANTVQFGAFHFWRASFGILIR